jgi:hypothetical protein
MQFIPHPLAGGIEQASSALSQGLGQFLQGRKQRRGAETLSGLLEGLGDEFSPQDLSTTLQQAIAQGVDPQQAMQAGTLYATLKKAEPKTPFAGKTQDELTELFQKFGMTPEAAARNAELYGSLTTGGQTKFADMFIDQIQRGTFTGDLGTQREDLEPVSPQANVETSDQPFNFPPINLFEGLKPAEKVKRESEVFSDNTSYYGEVNKELKSANAEARSIGQLENLNNRGNLPTGLGKALNINYKKGSLRVPAFANADTQLFVKTINEFVRKARDSFGARVTNFELNKFLEGLPTMANTPEGRRVILAQMGAMNKLNQLEADSQKEVMNHYGLRGTDRQITNSLAERMRASKQREIEAQFYRAADAQDDYVMKQNAPSGQIAVEVDGQRGYVPRDQLDAVLQRGGRQI